MSIIKPIRGREKTCRKARFSRFCGPAGRPASIIKSVLPPRRRRGLLFPRGKSSKSTLKGADPLENPLNVLFCLRYDLMDWLSCGVHGAVSSTYSCGYALLPGEAAGGLRCAKRAAYSVQREGTAAQQRNLPLEFVGSRRSPAHQRRHSNRTKQGIVGGQK